MRFIIDKQGNKCPVDDKESNISECRILETVTLVDENVYLEDRWMATAYKNKYGFDSRPDELDYENYIEKIFAKEPTEEELIHFMASNGLGLYDYVSVEKVKRINCNWDD